MFNGANNINSDYIDSFSYSSFSNCFKVAKSFPMASSVVIFTIAAKGTYFALIWVEINSIASRAFRIMSRSSAVAITGEANGRGRSSTVTAAA